MFNLYLFALVAFSIFSCISIILAVGGIVNKHPKWAIAYYCCILGFNVYCTFLYINKLTFMYNTLEWALSL